jgi:hypothetical protein
VECGEELEGALSNCILQLAHTSAERLDVMQWKTLSPFMETQQFAVTSNEEVTQQNGAFSSFSVPCFI